MAKKGNVAMRTVFFKSYLRMSAAPVVPFPEAAHLILSKQGNAAVNSESELVEKLRHPETRASKREHQRKKGSTGKKGKIFVEPVSRRH